MKKILLVSLVTLAFAALSFANETTTAPAANGGTVEKTTDTSHNPISGSNTATNDIVYICRSII
jgi:hypothetical protein